MNTSTKIWKRLTALAISLMCIIASSAVISWGVIAQTGRPEPSAVQALGASGLPDFSWDNATVYFALNDRFKDGNSSNNFAYGRNQAQDKATEIAGWEDNPGTFHGGDIAGLTQKINDGYFTDLGVNAIWITAPYEQIHGFLPSSAGGKGFPHYAYHGYYALDFTQMDESMGTAAEFGTFVDTAHKNGIRVVMDVVMNHSGYPNILDASEYVGGDSLKANWQNGYYGAWANLGSIGNLLNTNSAAWANKWWGKDWVRTDLAGYTDPAGDNTDGGNVYIGRSGGLPDFITEGTKAVDLPPLLTTKWTGEGRLNAEQQELDAFFLKTGLAKTVRNHEIKWLTDWVREYGIDGFRCDTAKHVELAAWKELKKQGTAALAEWKAANPDKAVDDSPFWMTGEVYNHTPGGNAEYKANGFDSLINFQFSNNQGDFSNGNIGNIYNRYAGTYNTDSSLDTLTYISSHDTQLYRGENMIDAGSKLIMTPGAVQIFYGDETARPLAWDDMFYGGTGYLEFRYRSDMNWGDLSSPVSAASKTLEHWQKIGKFREAHLAVGAGTNSDISAYSAESGYTFSRQYIKDGVSDNVVVTILAPRSKDVSIDVSSVFADGSAVRNAYNGDSAVVEGGSVTFNTGANGTILIESNAGQPVILATPGTSEFALPLEVALTVQNADSATYAIDFGTPVSYTDGETITIGETAEADEKIYLTLTGTKDGQSITRDYVYTKIDISNKKIAYYDNSGNNWSNVYCYAFWDGGGQNAAWPGVPLTAGDDGLYSYELENAGAGAKVIFNNNSEAQTNNLPINRSMLYDKSGMWYPYTPGEPAVGVSVESSTFASELSVTLGSYGADSAVYTITGSTGDTSDMPYTSGDSISIDANNSGDSVKLTLTATKGERTATRSFIYVKTAVEVTTTASILKPDWWTDVYLHVWECGTDNTNWPGHKLEPTVPGGNVYTYTFDSACADNFKLIFNNNSSQQTADIAYTKGSHRQLTSFADKGPGTWGEDPDYAAAAPIVIDSFTTAPAGQALIDTDIILNAAASGGTGELEYQFSTIQGSETNVLQAFSTTSSYTWTPNSKGGYTLLVEVKDAAGAVSVKTIDFTVKNAPVKNVPPVFETLKNHTVGRGGSVSFDLRVDDENSSDSVTLSAEGLPSGASFTQNNGTGFATGTFTWNNVSADTALGKHTVTFVANDGTLTVRKTVTITVTEAGIEFTVHFNSPYDTYTFPNWDGKPVKGGQWSLYYWYDKNPGETISTYSGESTGWGKKFTTVTIPQGAKSIGMIVCIRGTDDSWLAKSYDGDISIDVNKVKNQKLDVYNIQGQKEIYYSLEEAGSAKGKLSKAYLSDGSNILFNSSEPITIGTGISVVRKAADGAETILPSSFTAGAQNLTGHKLKLNTALTVPDIAGALVVVRKGGTDYPIDLSYFFSTAEFRNTMVYDGDDLGSTYTSGATTFKVWAPVSSKVVLKLYNDGNIKTASAPTDTIPMTLGAKGVWSVAVPRNLLNTFYTYTVTTGYGEHETADVYAKAAGVNGDRSMVVNLDATDPVGWENDRTPNPTAPTTDSVIWEVHVRDFSIDGSSGIPMAARGKYSAFTYGDTTINADPSKPATCVNYLKELGVTHVHLLPVYDYASVDETALSSSVGGQQYNWGYDPKNYNVPEGSYSSNPNDGNVRIREFKQMVMALHEAGIKVVMDVVYNHTYATEDSFFQYTVPDYYFRKSAGTFLNGSGCGNETASNHEMFRKYMIDSVVYWAEEYHIDGFRFDLMAIHDVGTMNAIRAKLDQKFPGRKILMYGEGWAAGNVGISDGAGKAKAAQLNNIAMFNDAIRDSVKGEHSFNGSKGFVNGGDVTDKLLGGIEASVGTGVNEWAARWADRSDKVITYTSAHDNLTLWDKLVGEGHGGAAAGSTWWNTTAQEYLDMNKMAGSIILTSHGIPFIQAGEEFARTKNGNENSYNSPDTDNKIDWTRVEKYAEINDYYKGVIEIRKAFSGFRNLYVRDGAGISAGTANIYVYDNSSKKVSYTLTNSVQGEWSKVAVLMNANSTPADMTVGGSGDKWVIIANGTKAGMTELSRTVGNTVRVPARSVVIAVEATDFGSLHSVSIAPMTNGSVTANRTLAASGDKVDLTVQPASGYQLTENSLKVTDADGAAVEIVNNSFTMPRKSVTVSAEFTAIEYSIAVDPAITNGKLTPSKSKAAYGDAIIVTAEPAAGYKLAANSLKYTAGSESVVITGNTFTMPSGNIILTAKFEAIGGGGSDPINPPTPPDKPNTSPDTPDTPTVPSAPIIPDIIDEEKLIEDLEKEGSRVIIKVKTPAVLSDTLVREIAKSNKDLVIQVFDDAGVLKYQWTFLAKDIKYPDKSVNFGIDISALDEAKNAELLTMTVTDKGLVLDFLHEGILPGEAQTVIPVGEHYADGVKLFCYYVNTATGKLELQQKDLVVKDGKVTLHFLHCSKYILTSEAISGAVDKTASAPTDKASNPKTGNGSITAALIVFFAALGLVVFTKQKGKRHKLPSGGD